MVSVSTCSTKSGDQANMFLAQPFGFIHPMQDCVHPQSRRHLRDYSLDHFKMNSRVPFKGKRSKSEPPATSGAMLIGRVNPRIFHITLLQALHPSQCISPPLPERSPNPPRPKSPSWEIKPDYGTYSWALGNPQANKWNRNKVVKQSDLRKHEQSRC